MSICAFLPEEMVVDILSRLPAKCLCGFKCVSKSWFALISSSNFARTHLNRNDKPERVFLIYDFIYSIDWIESSNNDEVIAMKLDFPWIKDPYLLDGFVASCNGLLLVRESMKSPDYDSPMHLLNPSTRESKKLPDYDFGVDPYSRYCHYGLGYDSSMDDYKVVAVSHYDPYLLGEDREPDCKDTFVVVYSLKTSSWGRKWIQDFPCDNSFIVPASGIFVNGSIHWLAYRSLVHLPVIVAFDVAEEKFRDVLLPTSQRPRSLGVLGMCLFCCNEDLDCNQDLWVMKEYGDTESWTKFTIYIPDNMYSWGSLCVLLDNAVLLKLYKDDQKMDEMDEDIFVIYNDKEKRLRYIMVDGIPLKTNGFLHYQQSAVTYVESIVSPYFHCGIDRKN